jgi:hypothetical protein
MKRANTARFYNSANGDMWFLGRDPATGLAFVRHEANIPSSGQVTDMDIGAFLSEPRHPQHEALLRLIGGLIPDRRQTGADDDHSFVDTGKEWSDAELFELGNLLVRGLSIEEIARLLRRDHGEVQDKVVETGRACRYRVFEKISLGPMPDAMEPT